MSDIFDNFNFAEALQNSIDQAIAFEKGEKTKARRVVREISTPSYNGEDVRYIREKLNLSQSGLAMALGVSKRTVEAWEAGKNSPSNSSNKLLYLLEKNDGLLEQLITA